MGSGGFKLYGSKNRGVPLIRPLQQFCTTVYRLLLFATVRWVESTLFLFFKDDIRKLADLKQQISQKMISLRIAYSIAFSVMADRTVWSPFLSRHRKWPRPPFGLKQHFDRV